MSWRGIFAVVWKLAATAYALVNVGGVPGALEGWQEFLQPLGASAGRVVGIVFLMALAVSLLPAKWRHHVIPTIQLPFAHRRDSVIARSDEGRDLLVEVLDEDWEVFEITHLVLEIQVRITNCTATTKRLTGLAMSAPDMDPATDDPAKVFAHIQDRQAQRGQYGRLPSQLAPHDSITFWHFVHLKRRIAEGGHGGYELGVTDEWSNHYVAVRSPEPGRRHVWGSEIVKQQDEQGGR